ncbi:MAG: hypothetical protein Tsb0020_41110 [Haliangiales bacterium]
MPITKSDLIEQLSAEARLPKGKAEHVVNVMFESMSAALEAGSRIELRGFGSFEVRDYKAYEGRNPRTGETVYVPAKRLPFFKVGKELRQRINGEVDTDANANANGNGRDNGQRERRADGDSTEPQPSTSSSYTDRASTWGR